MVRLIIADDHTIMRSGLKQLFALAPDIEIIGEAENGEGLLALLPQKNIDLLLMDLMMPGICSIELIEHIQSLFPTIAILVLSMHNEHQVAMRAIRAGASGYITKDSDPEKLLAAIFKVAEGGRYLDPKLAEDMAFSRVNRQQNEVHKRLSEREYEIFLLLAKGMSVNEIANQLNISNKTVSTHKVRLMEKMNFNSLSDLIRYAVNLEQV